MLPATALSSVEESIIARYPIGQRLDELRNELQREHAPQLADLQHLLSPFSSRMCQPLWASPSAYACILSSTKDTTDINLRLFAMLSALPAALKLPSRRSSGATLNDEFLELQFLLKKKVLPSDASIVLLERVLACAADADIWIAVYQLIDNKFSTPELSPPISPTLERVKSTPYKKSSSTIMDSSEYRQQMDSMLRYEVCDRMYLDVPGFADVFFGPGAIPNIERIAQDMFTCCQQEGHYVDGRWKNYPEPALESPVCSWLIQIIEFFKTKLEPEPSTGSMQKIPKSMRNNHLDGSVAKRKLDFALAKSETKPTSEAASDETSRATWKDILILGELKQNPSKSGSSETWFDLTRYVREIFGSQVTRRFVHGFTLCDNMMRLFLFDRGAAFASKHFNINKDGLKFVSAMLGYLIMNEEQMGFDPTISKNGDKHYMTTERGRFCLEKLIYHQPGIVCRGTTCWEATREGSSHTFVVKDSWQEEGRDEGVLLKEATDANVQNVAHLYHEETVPVARAVEKPTSDEVATAEVHAFDLFQGVRKGLNVESGKPVDIRLLYKYSSSGTTISSESSSPTNPLKRGSSDGTESAPKRLRSEGSATSQHILRPKKLINRIQKRLILDRSGTQIHNATSRRSLLKGLMDGIKGHRSLFDAGIHHRDISIGNILLSHTDGSNEEPEGFLIDLDHAIKNSPERQPGYGERTGTPIFMSIGALGGCGDYHSFMDDLESFFWVLYWICIHYSKNGERRVTDYKDWNFKLWGELSTLKAGTVSNEKDFLEKVERSFSQYYAPLGPWVNELRKIVFPGGIRWETEDMSLYDRMLSLLRRAIDDEAMAEPEEPAASSTIVKPEEEHDDRSGGIGEGRRPASSSTATARRSVRLRKPSITGRSASG